MNETLLKSTFYDISSRYTHHRHTIDQLWAEVEKAHSGSDRHYHTLQHLEFVLTQLKNVENYIENWDAVLLALYYHDIIYKAHKKNNEEKSADLAMDRMKGLNVPQEIIALTHKIILATKSHDFSNNSDTNYFTDADLSVLGRHWEDYARYIKQVRNEYSFFPDLIYNPGRKKVLRHFLTMDRIFKTDHFYQSYEAVARENIKRELDLY
jgi:predicted metal-dependent HD superfamily phosphohydrolase